MEWIENIFKRKPREYHHFKKVIYKYYGLCGAERAYIKLEVETGRYAQLYNELSIIRMNNKGFKLITELEYLSNQGE